MITAAEIIRALVENAGSNLRRAVGSALAIAVEHGLEREVLHALESQTNEGARWLRAALTETVDGPKASVSHWEAVVTQSGCEIPDALLHRARLSAREGDEHHAAALLSTQGEDCATWKLDYEPASRRNGIALSSRQVGAGVL